MAAFPWMCANCSLPPDWPQGLTATPCRRCGCVEFHNGGLVVKLKPAEHLTNVRFYGPMTAAFAQGLTANDRRFLRRQRIAWNGAAS